MKRIALAFVLISLLMSVSFVSRPGGAQQAKWTFMVYLDADNNLEGMGIENFLAMARVGSTDDVKIVVQFDRNIGNDNRYNDWSTTKRFNVTKDMLPTAANALQDLGEMNMADPATLVSFVQWAAASYPADHYFLDLWDHGLGWQGVAVDDYPSPNDHLSASELASALQQIEQYLGRPLDILANDACRMTLEIMYEAMPYVDYFVGSEKDEPEEGWPYDVVLGSLVANPSMTPVQLATVLVDEYVNSYRSGSSYSVTMALVDSDAIPGIVTSLDDLVTAVNLTLPYFSGSVMLARNESEHYEGNQCNSQPGGDDYDLYDVAAKLAMHVDSGRVASAVASLQSAIDSAVLHESHLDLDNAVNCVRARNAHGLSLWYPLQMGAKQTAYEQLALSRDSLWDEYLSIYRGSATAQVSFTVSLTGQDKDQDGTYDIAAVDFQSSSSGAVYADQYLDGSLASSFAWSPVLAQTAYQKEIALPVPGSYDFYFFFRQGTSTLNASSVHDFLIQVVIEFRGRIMDSRGNTLDGASVTLRNNRTNQTLATMASQGLYNFSVIYPVWLRNGDRIEIRAESEGNSAVLAMTFGYRRQKSVWVELYIDPDDNGGPNDSSMFRQYWSLLLVPIAALLAFTLIVGLLIVRSTRRGRRV